jgi:predicted dithiol-disulfide oxidoreductase (DUF899 family)
MTTNRDDTASALPGRPPIVGRAAWQAARDELLVREKAHTREGDAIAAARRRLPTTAWHVQDAVYLNARGVSYAVLTSGPWDEVAPYVEFMGYTEPWYSVRGLDGPVGRGGEHR